MVVTRSSRGLHDEAGFGEKTSKFDDYLKGDLTLFVRF